MSHLYIPHDILLELVRCLYQLDPQNALAICSLQKKDSESEIRKYLIFRCLHKKKFNPTIDYFQPVDFDKELLSRKRWIKSSLAGYIFISLLDFLSSLTGHDFY